MFNLILILLTTFSTLAALKTELSGNIEGQFRNISNNPEAKEAPLYQNWDHENFTLIYGNISGKIELNGSKIEANWFGRYTQSPLYDPSNPQDPFLASNIYTFPNRLVARDMLQLQDINQKGSQKTESILNKLAYEWEYQDRRLMLGRMYINYGSGEIFNPINPFNQPTALTSTAQVAQGNDGFSYTLFIDDKHTIQFLLLGDKQFHGYDGRFSKTVWAHGDYQYSNDLHFIYVIGEDQQRNKIGGQVSYQLGDSMLFSQLFYQTENVKNEPSTHLWDALLGWDQQITNKWHVRFEGGYQKQDLYADPASFVRFLPTEYFASVSNIYEIHPLVKLNGTIINDVKSGFTYFIGKATYNFWKNTELELFGNIPVSRGDETDNLLQRLVTTDVGVALRAFF